MPMPLLQRKMVPPPKAWNSSTIGWRLIGNQNKKQMSNSSSHLIITPTCEVIRMTLFIPIWDSRSGAKAVSLLTHWNKIEKQSPVFSIKRISCRGVRWEELGLTAGPHKGLRISADLKLQENPVEESLLTWPQQMLVGRTVSWPLGLPDLPGVDHLQRWAAKVGRFCNIWYTESAMSTGVELGKNKTGFHEVMRSSLPGGMQAVARKPSIRSFSWTR